MHNAIGETAARSTAPWDEGVEATMYRAAADMGPNWAVVRVSAGKADGRGAAAFLYAFLHPDYGVALVGAEHDPNAVARFKHEFAAAGFAAVFGGCPPVVYRALPPPYVPLAEVLQAAFALEPAPVLSAGDEHWLEAARRLIASPVLDEAEAAPPQDGAKAREPAAAELVGVLPNNYTEQPGRALRQRESFRKFVLVCGLLALVLGGVVVVWHFEQSEPGHGEALSVQPSKRMVDPEPSATAQDTAEACAADPRVCDDPPAPPSEHAALPGAAPDSGRSDAGTEPVPDAASPGQETVKPSLTLAEGAAVPSLGAVADSSATGTVPDSAIPFGPGSPDAGAPSSPSAVRDGAAPPDGPAGSQDVERPPSDDGAISRSAGALQDDDPGATAQVVPTGGTRAAEAVPPVSPVAPVQEPSAPPSSLAPPAADQSEPPRQTPGLAEASTSPAAPAAAAPSPDVAAPTGRTALQGAAVPRPDPDLLTAFVRRGDALFAAGNVSSARLLYERAAAGGSAAGAVAAGKTYDPAFLSRIGALGPWPDPAAAAAWYRKAITLGDPEAERLLQRLGGVAGN